MFTTKYNVIIIGEEMIITFKVKIEGNVGPISRVVREPRRTIKCPGASGFSSGNSYQ